MNTETKIPVEFIKEKSKGNVYIIKILNDIEIKESMYFTNNKRIAFEKLKNSDFAYSTSIRKVYEKMLNNGVDKLEALEKIKTLRALINL